MVMMTAGMATISGATLAAYAGLGADPGHLLTASIISAPAALVIAKIMIPELEELMTKGVVKVQIGKQDANILDAACRGAAEGAKLAVNVEAMLAYTDEVERFGNYKR
jgi:CNT family concentrative nucleoside transporter